MSVGATAGGALEGIRFYMEQARQLSFDRARSILKTELLNDWFFQKAWETAQLLYPSKRLVGGDVMEEECYLAIISYTLERPNVCKHFNALCREARDTQSSWDAFPFKSLWFFLISAFEKLPPYSAERLFRGVKTFHSNLDGSVTFGQFVSASECEDVASRFGGRWGRVLTLDGVPQELVRNIDSYSYYGVHSEVLLWPFCNFKLVSETEGPAPGTPSKSSPPRAAKTTTNDPEVPEVSNES
ncbi:uncharacterized protein LOC121835137 [Ixodes scapularis]|uniref:uncharacterized protein LOC121835137 n=1 Tax=Ixodes scapularis TaxID=6945 RepID=UPI001C391852|nr:uncharacterized protein LOC121835137 [Ixodes scapularis]